MSREETIQSIRELADLMDNFMGDREELLLLIGRMRIRLDHLQAHAIAGRPDLAAKLRGQVTTAPTGIR